MGVHGFYLFFGFIVIGMDCLFVSLWLSVLFGFGCLVLRVVGCYCCLLCCGSCGVCVTSVDLISFLLF